MFFCGRSGREGQDENIWMPSLPWNFNFSKPWKCQKLSVLPHKLVAVMSTHQPLRPLFLSYQPGKHWNASAYKSYGGSLCTMPNKCTCQLFVHSLWWLNLWLWCGWPPTLPMCACTCYAKHLKSLRRNSENSRPSKPKLNIFNVLIKQPLL